MSYIFESFKDWKKKVNEDKVKIENTIDQTMTIKVINSNKFRVKARWGGDVVDAMGNLTQNGWNRIVEEIRRSELSKSLPGINDFTKYVAVYRVIKDTDTAKDDRQNIKKQFFEFDLVGRPKGLPANIEYALDNEIEGLIQQGGQGSGSLTQSTNTKQGEILGGTSNKKGNTFGLNFSKGAVPMTNLTDPKLVALVDSLYFKVTMDGSLAGNPQVKATMQGVKNELKAATLGDNSKTLISALNAAFSISTRYGDPETGVTQTLVNSVAGVKGKDEEGVALSEVDGFNMGAFLANLKPISDIKVPAGGFVKGKVTKDDQFAKFQKLLVAKFQKSLGSSQIYKNFAKFNIGGADGTYGSNTANLVGLLKNNLTDPKWTGNMDKNNVDQAFVDRINQEKVAESYIGLDGFTVITEGLDMAGVQSYEKSNPVVRSSNTSVSTAPVASGQKYLLQGKDGYEYFVKDSVWHYKKDGGALQIVLSGDTIKRLQKLYPEAKAYYILTYATTVNDFKRANKHLYKLENKVWKIQLFGSTAWQTVESTEDISRLNTMYSGGGTSSVGGSTSSSSKGEITAKEGAEFDKRFKTLLYQIKTFFETDSNFEAYSGGNDDEIGAWKNIVMKKIKNTFEPALDKIYADLKSHKDDSKNIKADYIKNVSKIKGTIFWNGSDADSRPYSAKAKFIYGSRFKLSFKEYDKPFTITLNLFDGVKKYEIQTDF